MKIRYFALMFFLFLDNGWADFSNASIELHPLFPGDGPFILEISGEWPSDCHPGEQKPVIRAFDQQSLSIELEIIVVHVTCNDVITPYRVLVDVSRVAGAAGFSGDTLDVEVDFDGLRLERTVALTCVPAPDCMDGQSQRPVPGVFHAPELRTQGILVARQATGMAVFPLSYDETGAPEWLISGGHMQGDTFFGRISRREGGDCFGCEATNAMPDKVYVGYLSVLADGPATLQVKVDDGLFREYRSLVYGYGNFSVGPAGEQTLVDLEGRWGITENRGTNPPLGDLTEFLPAAFDLELEHIINADSSIQQDGQVSYLLTTLTGEPLGQVICRGQTAQDGQTPVCEFIDPTDAAEPLFWFFQDGPSNLSIEYGRAVIAVGTPPGGRALRMD